MSRLGAIAAVATGTYTRTRTAVGTTTDGHYTPGSTSTASVIANVQPFDLAMDGGDALQINPEGRRADAFRLVITASELIARPVPDRLTIDGAEWEVRSVEKWDALGEVQYEAVVARVGL